MKIKKLIKLFKNSTGYICEKCGWQTQRTPMTDKLKEHCKECKCEEKTTDNKIL